MSRPPLILTVLVLAVLLSSAPEMLGQRSSLVLTTEGVDTNGVFRLRCKGGGNTVWIEASTNLRDWASVGSLKIRGGNGLFADPNASSHSYRFYRARVGRRYSDNIAGYARVTCPPGYSTIANQFVSPRNTAETFFGVVPAGTTLSKFRPATGDYEINNYDPLFAWLEPDQPFMTGEAAFILNPLQTPFEVVQHGELTRGTASRLVVAGYSMTASLLPQPGGLSATHEFPGADGDIVFLYRDGSYRVSQHDPLVGDWDHEPVLNVGEGFLLYKATPANWEQSIPVPAGNP